MNERASAPLDAVIVGAGFAGLYALYALRRLGFSARVFEAGDDVGGTWYWNRYPGARCDVESLDYSYSFSPELEREWLWSERYAAQPEILAYAQHVADRFDLRRDIRFNTHVEAAHFDEVSKCWHVRTSGGEVVAARFCIMATGCLSAGRLPDIPGLAEFKGNVYRTSQWPKEGVDFTGQRVAVIGTGSSGIQAIPLIAKQAAQLTVFQRTPNFSIPARNRPLDPAERQSVMDDYPRLRDRQRTSFTSLGADPPPVSALAVDDATREREYRAQWELGGIGYLFAYNDLIVDRAANETAAEFIRARIGELVRDPQTAARLQPRSFPIGTKRLCLDSGYYDSFNRSNVRLVDLRETPIERVTPTGLRTTDESLEFDSLVFATGFDAVTGALLRIDIRGRGGQRLADKWVEGPKMYLGLMASGFPNLFAITGPGSPSVLSNMIVSIEQHVEFIAELLVDMRARGANLVDAQPEAEQAWVEHVAEVAGTTLYPLANSWYMGANIPGKTRVFLPYVGGVGPYRQKCKEIAAAGYTGFTLSA
jgi:cyclohexanone monooxygenase